MLTDAGVELIIRCFNFFYIYILAAVGIVLDIHIPAKAFVVCPIWQVFDNQILQAPIFDCSSVFVLSFFFDVFWN